MSEPQLTPAEALVKRLAGLKVNDPWPRAAVLEVARAAARYDAAAKAHGAWFIDDDAPALVGGLLERELSEAERALSDALDALAAALGIA